MTYFVELYDDTDDEECKYIYFDDLTIFNYIVTYYILVIANEYRFLNRRQSLKFTTNQHNSLLIYSGIFRSTWQYRSTFAITGAPWDGSHKNRATNLYFGETITAGNVC